MIDRMSSPTFGVITGIPTSLSCERQEKTKVLTLGPLNHLMPSPSPTPMGVTTQTRLFSYPSATHFRIEVAAHEPNRTKRKSTQNRRETIEHNSSLAAIPGSKTTPQRPWKTTNQLPPKPRKVKVPYPSLLQSDTKIARHPRKTARCVSTRILSQDLSPQLISLSQTSEIPSSNACFGASSGE